MKTAVVVTTFNRPAKLARSLPQIVAAAKEVGAPVLVVDDGGSWERGAGPNDLASSLLTEGFDVRVLNLTENRGLAGALNIGLSYWLADPSIEAISYFQDDVDVDQLCLKVMNALCYWPGDGCVYTGHNAAEHPRTKQEWAKRDGEAAGISGVLKEACRATHMHARREAWAGVMPIRSRGIGLPSRELRDAHRPELRGTGSGVDWWIVRDCQNRLQVLCVPGLVRTFAWKKADSTWDNEQKAGEDGPLSRDAIRDWLQNRG